MAEEPGNLRECYANAEKKRTVIERSWDTNTASYQDVLSSAISLYERCTQLANTLSIFSPNESLEDISSRDLQYILLDYRLAEVLQRRNTDDRKALLQRVQTAYTKFLTLLDSYDILGSSDAKLFEQYKDSPTSFSTASTSDPTARRDLKIKRFKQEKELRQTLEYLQRNPSAIENDDALYRRLQLAQIAYCTHQTFASLESIAQELHILSLAPPDPVRRADNMAADLRERNGRHDGYSERLDAPHLSAGLSGPLLDPQGKPMRPFTLLDKRSRMQQGVFRPDHSLPTMTIDEYLEEEKKRGGIIDGGGPQSGMRPEPNEDDFDKADEETMKARAWDEFVEANPKGSGNTLNRG